MRDSQLRFIRQLGTTVAVAPAPRRFAQAMAGTFALIVGLALLEGATVIAWTVEGLFAAGVTAAVFGDFCGPAQLYGRLRRTVQTDARGASTIKRRNADGVTRIGA